MWFQIFPRPEISRRSTSGSMCKSGFARVQNLVAKTGGKPVGKLGTVWTASGLHRVNARCVDCQECHLGRGRFYRFESELHGEKWHLKVFVFERALSLLWCWVSVLQTTSDAKCGVGGCETPGVCTNGFKSQV